MKKDLIAFLEDLGNNNNREWFAENKKRYQTSVKEPFELFVGDMINRLQAIDPSMKQVTPKDCIFRIYRDVRFSKDKSPYKKQVSAILSPKGRKDMTSPGMYIQIEAEKAGLYSGLYQLDKNQLLAVREAIAQDLKGFDQLINDKKFKKTYGTVQGEKNKRLKTPFKELAEEQPLFFNKSFYFFKEYKPGAVVRKDWSDKLLKDYEVAQPLNDFFRQALKNV